MNEKFKNHEEAKKAASACYEAGDFDAAIECLRGVPRDDDVHALLVGMRIDEEAKGIVSHIDPETRKYFADLKKKMGI